MRMVVEAFAYGGIYIGMRYVFWQSTGTAKTPGIWTGGVDRGSCDLLKKLGYVVIRGVKK